MDQIGPYRIVESLGAGGMAHVWRGVDAEGHEAAIKVLDARIARSMKARTRFYSEATNMAAVQHENVVQVYDHGEDKGVIWLAMELLDGGSADVWLRRHGPMPPRMAAEVTIAVLHGLEAVHAAGVIHRDIKPSNVLLASDGRIKITDFGIARGDVDTHAEPAKGAVTGTWVYMAPEQRVDAKAVDERADVYGAGGTLWALLTGHDPADLVAPESTDTLPAPAEIVGIVRRALRFNPEDRYASAAMMRADLEIARATLPPDPPGTPELGEVLLGDLPPPAPKSWEVLPEPSLPKGWDPDPEAHVHRKPSFASATPVPKAHVYERPYPVEPEAPPPSLKPEPPPQPAAPVALIVVFATASLVAALGVLFALTSGAEPPAEAAAEVDPYAPIVPEGVEILPPPESPAEVQPEAPKPAGKARTKPGRLLLLSPVASLGSIDGQSVGDLPVEVEVPTGTYRVRLHQARGVGEASVIVDIEPEAATEVCWSFARSDYCSDAELALARTQW